MVPEVFKSARRSVTSKDGEEQAWDSLVCSLHLRASLWGAKFRNCAVEKVDLVVKVDD